MKEIEASASVLVPADEIEAQLTPEAIVDYAQAYEIVDAEDDGDVRVLYLESEEFDLTLEFSELERGYEYRQRGSEGPFEEMSTRITFEEHDDRTEISAHSAFTFGGILRFVLDHFAVKYRIDELERTVGNLVVDVADEEQIVVDEETAADSGVGSGGSRNTGDETDGGDGDGTAG